MEKFRSMSVKENRDRTDSYYYGGNKPEPPTSMHDLRSYSTSYASSSTHQEAAYYTDYQKEVKIKKSKSSKSSASNSKGWILNDPELQRKKRVASYKVYAVEGKMKGSLRKSFRWIKEMVWR